MFDIGFGEMVLLAAIALIAIGPKQLPEVARTVGKLLNEFKKAVGDVTSTVANARDETDRAIRKVTDDLTGITDDINKDLTRGLNIQSHLEAKPIVPLAQHAGDPIWMVDPSRAKPGDGESGIPSPGTAAMHQESSVVPATGAAPFAMAPARANPPASNSNRGSNDNDGGQT